MGGEDIKKETSIMENVSGAMEKCSNASHYSNLHPQAGKNKGDTDTARMMVQISVDKNLFDGTKVLDVRMKQVHILVSGRVPNDCQ